MITDSIKSFVEGVSHAFVASADSLGVPHLALGAQLSVPDPNRLAFEAWFCTTTLSNVRDNPRVAVAVADPVSKKGYQFLGRVESEEETALLNGYLPDEQPGMPQVQTRLCILVEVVLEFTAGAHTDLPVG